MTASPLKQRINEDVKSAMRGREKQRLAVLRLILAALKQREVDERIELDDSQIVTILDKMAKQRREAIAQYQQANRPELEEQESFELLLIQDYMPAPLSESEIEQLLETAISEATATSMKDMGKVMGILKPRVQGRTDMTALSKRIKLRLS